MEEKCPVTLVRVSDCGTHCGDIVAVILIFKCVILECNTRQIPLVDISVDSPASNLLDIGTEIKS